MPVIYDNTMKAARLTGGKDAVVNGTLELMSAADAVLAIFTLNGTAGSVTNAVWTLGFASTASTGEAAAGAGTNITKARIKNSGGTVRITGLTVGLTGADIIVDNVNIAEDQAINLVGAQTITHAVDPS
jgi:hypothetical protein